MRDRRVGAVLVTEADRRLLGIFTGVMPFTAFWPREKVRPGQSWPGS